MGNRNRLYTSDPIFSKPLLDYMGDDIVLPDQTTIRAILHVQESTQATDMMGNFYTAITTGKIPTTNLGTLAAGQVVEIDGEAFYVATLQPTEKGWSVFVLESRATL